MTNIAERVNEEMPTLESVLAELVAIPSISSDPTKRADVDASAQYVQSLFAGIGFEASIETGKNPDGTDGMPAVIATGPSVPGRPTVLLYAHHDVQPLGELERWSKPALQLTREGDRLYGRGSADCGIGIAVHYGALRALAPEFPVNLVVFVEGEEEIGSPSFADFLQRHRDRLKADVIIVADSNNWTVEVPALTSSLRGLAGMDVSVKVLDHAVHSGMYGGPILDAVTLSARLISSLHDANGAVAVEGLGGSTTAEVDWSEEDLRRDAGVVDGAELVGVGDLASRVWTQPAISVIGMDARSVAESSNTIAPECKFRLSVRTVPGEDPASAYEAVKAHLQQNRPFGAELTIEPTELGDGYQASDGPAASLFKQALGEAWETAPVAIGVGGSIPFISTFAAVFPSAEILVTGVEDPASNAHSEDESASITVLENATVAEARFLELLATSRADA